MSTTANNETLTWNDQHTITHGLRTAAEKFNENAVEFRKLADFLRDGGEYPMFASGESGARAADRLADQFDAQALDSRHMADLVERSASVELIDVEPADLDEVG